MGVNNTCCLLRCDPRGSPGLRVSWSALTPAPVGSCAAARAYLITESFPLAAGYSLSCWMRLGLLADTLKKTAHSISHLEFQFEKLKAGSL